MKDALREVMSQFYADGVPSDVVARAGRFPEVRNNGYRTRAQVDVLMPGNLSKIGKKYKFDKEHLRCLQAKNGITRSELQRIAANVLRFALTRME
jgi:beta-glucosidase